MRTEYRAAVTASLVALLTPQTHAQNAIDPETAAEIQDITSVALETMSIFHDALLNPKNWIDLTLQDIIVARTEDIQAELFRLDVLLQGARQGDTVLAAYAYASGQTIEAGYRLIAAEVSVAAIDAIVDMGNALADMLDTVAIALHGALQDWENCANQLDDDGDGLVDKDDPECG